RKYFSISKKPNSTYIGRNIYLSNKYILSEAEKEMPLPSTLLHRLAQRGIVNIEKSREKECEETFAEDYSEKDDVNPENFEYHTKKRDDNIWMVKVKRRFKETTKGVKGCPNKWNVFHICTVFCLERWGEGQLKPSKSYKERYNRLIKRYPIPKNWINVWDPGCEAYYFWNQLTNEVSWLPPKHPKAIVCKAAAMLRREKDKPEMDIEDEETLCVTNSLPEEEAQQRSLTVPKKVKSRDLDKILRYKKFRKHGQEYSDILDPMDPASYGDCARGSWSSGLDSKMTDIRRRKHFNSLSPLLKLDVFEMNKLPEEIEQKSIIGGTISFLSRILIGFMIYKEMQYYFDTSVAFKFIPDAEIQSKLKFNLDITVKMPFAEILYKSNENFDLKMPERSLRPVEPYDACRIHGTLTVNKVAGNFHITGGKSLYFPQGHLHLNIIFGEVPANFSHRITKLSFGNPQSVIVQPLEYEEKIITDEKSLIIYYIEVVPTDIETFRSHIKAYQYSVKENIRHIDHNQGSHGTPGIYIKYDMSALKVRVLRNRENILKLLIRLCSVTSGIIVISRIINRFLQKLFENFLNVFAPGSYAMIQEKSSLNANSQNSSNMFEVFTDVNVI
ncbi:CLUMA_CG020985, isoform A, partial [Clunio marinus]